MYAFRAIALQLNSSVEGLQSGRWALGEESFDEGPMCQWRAPLGKQAHNNLRGLP